MFKSLSRSPSLSLSLSLSLPYINNLGCDERNIHSIKSFCSPDLEFHKILCRPFWLKREFTAIIITAVYIPPQANTDQALRELYGYISEQETTQPDAAFIITGDFNKANFRTIAPKYFQHITINTRGDRILDHCYSPFLRPQPTPVLPVHTRVYSNTQLQRHRQMCRRHNGDRPDHRQR